jgi:hypothetical protein
VVDEAVARERMARRIAQGDASRSAHADAELLSRGGAPFERISLLAPSIEVETTNGYAPGIEAVVAFINKP